MKTLPTTSIVARLGAIYEQHQQAFHLALVLLCGFAAYANTLSVPFYFDDLPCIVENPVVHDLDNLSRLGDYWQIGIKEDIRNNVVTRIVTYLTFAANYRLHGLAVDGYHILNLLLHLANAVFVYQLVRLARNPAPEDGGRNDRLALIVALLFVAHPVMTNAVTYIVQRFAVLATFFALVALCTYTLSVRANSIKRQRWLYAGALTATILAMYSKEIAFTLPLLIALFDWNFLTGERRQRLRRLAPFFATMLLLPLTVMALANISDVTGQNSTNALNLANISHGSRWSYFLTQWPVTVTYLRLLIFPVGLHLEYDFPRFTTLWNPTILVSGLLLATLLGGGIRLLCRRSNSTGYNTSRRLTGFGIVWFFITLAMESSFIPLDDLIFEYRLYLPSFGFFLAVTGGADLLCQRFALNRPAINTFITIVATLLITSLTIATILRNRTWQDARVFWQDNINKSPNRARPRCNLADAYWKNGDAARAIAELEEAGRVNPNYWVPFELLGDIRSNQQLYNLAAADYQEAVRRGNLSRGIFLKLGRAQRWSGNYEGARNTFKNILAINPNDAEAQSELDELWR